MDASILDFVGLLVFAAGFVIRSAFLKKSNDFLDYAPALYCRYCLECGYRDGFRYYQDHRTEIDYNEIRVPSHLATWFNE